MWKRGTATTSDELPRNAGSNDLSPGGYNSGPQRRFMCCQLVLWMGQRAPDRISAHRWDPACLTDPAYHFRVSFEQTLSIQITVVNIRIHSDPVL